jgi:hypothetical protein
MSVMHFSAGVVHLLRIINVQLFCVRTQRWPAYCTRGVLRVQRRRASERLVKRAQSDAAPIHWQSETRCRTHPSLSSRRAAGRSVPMRLRPLPTHLQSHVSSSIPGASTAAFATASAAVIHMRFTSLRPLCHTSRLPPIAGRDRRQHKLHILDGMQVGHLPQPGD